MQSEDSDFSTVGDAAASAPFPRDVDYYEVFELSPNARPDTIQRVYRILARRYHPDNPASGDKGMFKKLVDAYHVLSDPERRAAYDVHWHAHRRIQWQIFNDPGATTKVAIEKRKRESVLALLYTKRVNDPATPDMTIHEMEELLGCPRAHLEVSLWYLRKRSWIECTDNGRFSITVDGFDQAEEHGAWHVPKDRLLTAGKSQAAASEEEFLRAFVTRYKT